MNFTLIAPFMQLKGHLISKTLNISKALIHRVSQLATVAMDRQSVQIRWRVYHVTRQTWLWPTVPSLVHIEGTCWRQGNCHRSIWAECCQFGLGGFYGHWKPLPWISLLWTIWDWPPDLGFRERLESIHYYSISHSHRRTTKRKKLHVTDKFWNLTNLK